MIRIGRFTIPAWWRGLQARNDDAWQRYQDEQICEAEERWRQSNAHARAVGCKCGRPATQVCYHHGNTGSVPVEFWTCDEHVNVNMWSGAPQPDGSIRWTPSKQQIAVDLTGRP